MTEVLSKTKKSEAGFFCTSYVGLRCALLLIVLEGHYWYESTRDIRLHPLTFAVPCFFVLSGFLISHTLFRYEGLPWKEAAKIFYARRALRILPPFYFVLLLMHLVYGLPYLGWQLLYAMNIRIFLLSAFEPNAFVQYALLHDSSAMHFWSVNVEEQYYLLYPLFIAATHRRGRTAGLFFMIGLCIAARAYLYNLWHHTFYGGLTIVAGEYILWGCLFAWMDHRGKFRWLRNHTTLYISLIAFVFIAFVDKSYGTSTQWKPPTHATVYAVLLAAFVLAMRYSQTSLLGRVLSLRILAPVGQVSYGAYLLHPFVNPWVDNLVETLPFLLVFPKCPRAVAGPLVTIGAALIMWHLLEKPINSLRHHFQARGGGDSN